MSNFIYPSLFKGLLRFNILRSAEFNNIAQRSPSGSAVYVRQNWNPIWHWTLQYDYIYDNIWPGPNNTKPYAPYSDIDTMIGFFLRQGASADDFLFTDPAVAWNTVGPALISAAPNPAAALSVVTDGTNFYSPLQHLWGGFFGEDITDLNGSVVVYANGVLRTSGYTIAGPGLAIPGHSYIGMYINWGTSAPAAPVTAQFSYYHRVRFEEDTQDFEQFLYGVWTISSSHGASGSGSVKLMTSRPVGL